MMAESSTAAAASSPPPARRRFPNTNNAFVSSLNHRTVPLYAAFLDKPCYFLVALLRMVCKFASIRLEGRGYSEVDLFDLNNGLSLDQVLAMRSPLFTANFQESDVESIIAANERAASLSTQSVPWNLTG